MSAPQKESVLVVEDDYIVAKVIEKNLLELGYSVAGLAATGDDAVIKAGSERPDLVLMDIHLQGGMDGITAAGKISSSFDIPVVFLTAFSDQPTFERALVTSPYGYIVKPFSRTTLATTIRVALNKKQTDQKKTDVHFWLDRTVSLLSEGIITIDSAGRIILVNQAAEMMTGWTNGEAYQQPLDSVLTFRDPINGDLFHYNILPILREGIIGTIPNDSLIISKRNTSRLIEERLCLAHQGPAGGDQRGGYCALSGERDSCPAGTDKRDRKGRASGPGDQYCVRAAGRAGSGTVGHL